MSQENMEIVREVIAASKRGDMNKVFAAYDPSIEWRIGRLTVPITDLEPVYHGHDGIRAFWRTWFEAWDSVSFEYEELIDAGNIVVTVLSQRMRGRASGVEQVWTSYGQNWTMHAGKVVRVEFFPNRAEALEAAGLRE